MNKQKNLTELVFILDKSGSMANLATATIDGFNSMVKEQKVKNINALLTTVLFNDFPKILHDRIKISEVPKMTKKDYFPIGTTALLDAIGATIKHISTIHRYAREEDKPNKTLFVITTDGYENASRVFSFEKVKRLIEKHKENNNWEFLFIGSNIDAIGMASKIGVDERKSANLMPDKKGTHVLFQTVSETCACYCEDNDVIGENWKTKIDQDFKRRKKEI